MNAFPPRTDSSHLVWPPEQFYWSVVEHTAYAGRGVLPPGLVADVADDFPVDVESLHIVTIPDEHGSLIVCAACREMLAALDKDVVSVKPSSAPPALDVDVSQLELMTGSFEPVATRRRRLRGHLTSAATCILCTGLVITGLQRRIDIYSSFAHALSEARAGLFAAADIEPDSLDGLVERANALDELTIEPTVSTDASNHLAALLNAWPPSSDMTVESMSVTDGKILASISLTSDPSGFLSAFTPPSGWQLEEPRLSSTRGLTRLLLQLTKAQP